MNINTYGLRFEKENSDASFQCIRCHEKVSPQWCYKGSILSQQAGSKHYGSMLNQSTREIDSTVKYTGFYKRTSGLICDKCAGEYRGITDKKGNFHPFVKTESRPQQFAEKYVNMELNADKRTKSSLSSHQHQWKVSSHRLMKNKRQCFVCGEFETQEIQHEHDH